jgi:hypothetical protein
VVGFKFKRGFKISFGKCFEKLEKKKKERDFLSSSVLA